MQRISRLDNDEDETPVDSISLFHKSVDPEDFLAMARRMHVNYNLTPGRAVVKAMEELKPGMAVMLKGSDDDPYYDSTRQKVIAYLEKAIGIKNVWFITEMERAHIYWLFPESFHKEYKKKIIIGHGF